MEDTCLVCPFTKIIEQMQGEMKDFRSELKTISDDSIRKDEQNKQIQNSLSLIQASIITLSKEIEDFKSKPMRKYDRIGNRVIDKIVDFAIMAIVFYLMYLAKGV